MYFYKKDGCSGCFNSKNLIECLTETEKQEWDANLLKVKFKKGEVIFKQGTFSSNVCLIQSGLVKISIEFEDKILILRIEPEGQIVGLQSICGKNINHYTCTALNDCEVAMIDLNYIKNLMLNNAKFAYEIAMALSEGSIASYDRMICLTQKKAHGRVADILLCLSQRIYKSLNFHIHFDRKDFADLSNMSVENLIRIMSDFKRDGIINLNREDIEILDIERLMKVSLNG